MLLLAFVASLAAGIPQDVYDAPPVRPDIASVFEEVTRAPLVMGEMPRPNLYHRLAVAYSSGDGVERDVVVACGYAQLADASARVHFGGDGRMETEKAKLCDPLTYSQRVEAWETLGLPTVGPRRGTVVELEPGWWVVLKNGRQVVIEHPAGTTETLLPMYPGGRFVRVQHNVVTPSSGGRARHVLQTWFWTSAMTEKGVVRSLSWEAIEVLPAKLVSLDRRTWSEAGAASAVAPDIPPHLAHGARFRIGVSGQIICDIAESGELGTVRGKSPQ